MRGGALIFMETACNRHTDVALSPEGLGTRLAQMALHYALMLRASTALVDISLQYPYTLLVAGTDGLGGSGLFWHQCSGNGPRGPFIPDKDGPG